MAEWLERAVAVQEVLSSIPGLGGHKNLCGNMEPSVYVSFHRAVKREWFHTLKTHYTKPRTTLHLSNAMPVGTGS